jgi:hypothetical protein
VAMEVVRKPLKQKELSAFLSCMRCAEVKESKRDRSNERLQIGRLESLKVEEEEADT